ncbi:MAG: hypothetical protein ACYDH8_01785 [Syntrophales bacterium]
MTNGFATTSIVYYFYGNNRQQRVAINCEESILTLIERIGESFFQAVELIYKSKGRFTLKG